MFVNATKIYQSKVRISEIKDYTPSFRNVSKYFTINNMKKAGLKCVVKFFSVDFNPIDNDDVLVTHKCLMKRTWYKIMFGLIKKIFMGLLINIVNASNHTKCLSLSNQKCEI